jgi:hypothetical protein
MTKTLVPADLLKTVQAADKPASASAGTGQPKTSSHPKPAVKASNRPQAKSAGVAHTRMSTRGK